MLPSASAPIQPVLIIVGLIIDWGQLQRTTEEFLQLKHKFFPGLFVDDRRYFLSGILREVKGADIRREIATSGRNTRRHRLRFLNGLIAICERHDIKLIGRVWVKGIGGPFDGTSVYTYSVQSIYTYFQEYLRSVDDIGVVVADSRWQSLNEIVSHSIFTQKFRSFGDAFDRIIELPAFAHSNNHAGIQISDLFSSSLLFPIAVNSYCVGHVRNLHVRPNYRLIKSQFAARLQTMQYRYREASGRWRGGITVSDAIAQRSGSLLFS